jgi:uncharacterized membrane protein
VLSNKNHHGREEADAERLLKWAAAIALAVFIAAVIIIKIYSRQFWDSSLATDTASWGQTGDFIGGLINPIVGLATVLLIFISIHIQRSELRATASQLNAANQRAAQQNFEQSLFSWLTTYRELLNAMEGDVTYNESTVRKQGRRLLNGWYETKLTLNPMGIGRCFGFGFSTVDQKPLDVSKVRYLAAHADAYRTLFRSNQSELDAYLRTLYRLFQWIDDNPDLEPLQKYHYAALVRAQLSWVELAFLFYNGFTAEGAAFVPYYERYAIFDNIKTGKDLLIDAVANRAITHFGLLDDGPCKPLPYTDACFSSDLARRSAFFASS